MRADATARRCGERAGLRLLRGKRECALSAVAKPPAAPPFDFAAEYLNKRIYPRMLAGIAAMDQILPPR
jgi:hypothetical protein